MEQSPPTLAPPASGWLRRFGFRFLAVYLFLFNLPVLGIEVDPPIWPQRLYTRVWQAIVPWVGFHLFGLKDAYTKHSFVWDDSDSWFAWIRWWCYLATSLVAAVIWACFDRSRRRDHIVHEWLRIYVRYALVVAMFGYGFVKVFLEQFPNNELDVIFRRWVEFSPYMLLWGVLGHSNTYQAFAGLTELAGGCLLLFRRTTTLGALIIAAVMTNVVMFDLCFDIPVKLNALNFLGFAIFLTYPDWKRLANFFILNRPVDFLPSESWWAVGRNRKVAVASRVLFVGFILYHTAFIERKWRLPSQPTCELYGWYDVETFKYNGSVLPPLLGDTNRWLNVMFTKNGRFGALRMDERPAFDYWPRRVTYNSADANHGTIMIRPTPESPDGSAAQSFPPLVWAYTRTGPGQLHLDGTNDGAVISVRLHRIDHEKLPLLKQKFRWGRQMKPHLFQPGRPARRLTDEPGLDCDAAPSPEGR